MHSKYYLTEEIKPNVDTLGNVAFTADDVLFDWVAFEIPKGTAAMVSFVAKMMGTNGSPQKKSTDLFFAKSIDGVAPPTLGSSNDAKSAINASKVRPYLIGFQRIIPAADSDSADSLVTYNILGNGQGSDTGDRPVKPILLQGDPDGFPGDSTHSKTTPGYQTLFAAATIATADFGTGVTLNQAGHQAISTSAVDLIVTGVDANKVFAIGDELVSFVAADGSVPKQIGTVTSIPDADSIVVDAVAEAFNHTTEICNRNPVTFRLGFEY